MPDEVIPLHERGPEGLQRLLRSDEAGADESLRLLTPTECGTLATAADRYAAMARRYVPAASTARTADSESTDRAREEGIRIGREAAAQAILDHAEKHFPIAVDGNRGSAPRRWLGTAARIASNPITHEQVAAALIALKREPFAIVCNPPEPDTPVPEVRVLTWDWREQPDMDELATAVHDLSVGGVHVHKVETHSDQYAIILATDELDDETVAEIWSARFYGDDNV